MEADVQIELRQRLSRIRSSLPDSAVLVAIVGGASGALVALIAGVLRILENYLRDQGSKADQHKLSGPQQGEIVLRGADGTTVVVPVGSSHDDLLRYAKIALELNHPEIHIYANLSSDN